jgi:hypothetical protein
MSDSLFPEVDNEVVVSEVLMLRAENDKTILVLEGSSDGKLLWEFVDHDHCNVVIAEGKENALAAMTVVRVEGTGGVVCIVDRDYDDFLQIDNACDDVIVTEFHDMEQVVLHSNALSKLLREMGSKPKLDNIAATGRNPLDIVVEAAYPLGLLRYISLRDNLNLKFEGLSFRAFDRRTIQAQDAHLCRDVKNHSRSAIECNDLLLRLHGAKSNDHDKRMMCCGHDLMVLLGKGLLCLFGNQGAQSVEKVEIESRMRLAFSWEDFRSTTVYLDLKKWEESNQEYFVLREAA